MVRRSRAILGTAAFALAAPGTMLVLIPLVITNGHYGHPAIWSVAVGSALLALGGGVGLHAMARFVVDCRGTPAPSAAPEQLVVGGLYRYVRNPMYLAVVVGVAGEALLFARPILILWAVGFWLLVGSWVRMYEEPTLSRRFGGQYNYYCQHVRRWVPRLRPWTERVSEGH